MYTSPVPANSRPVPDLPGYRICTEGIPWTCRQRINRKGTRGAVWVETTDWKKLATHTHKKTGYVKVQIKNVDYLLHRLVLVTFVGPCPDGMVCCHADGDRLNNRPDNLRWDTSSENYKDSVRHGTDLKGEQCNSAKLTDDKVREIRTQYAAGGVSQRKLAREYGVLLQAIQDGIHRRTWKHVP